MEADGAGRWAGSGTFEKGEGVTKGMDDVGVELGILGLGPSFALEPEDLAADALCRHDVLAVTVADDQHVLGREAEGLAAEAEDLRVGLANTNHGALYHLIEIGVEVEVFQHGLYIAVEVADKHEGEASGDLLEDRTGGLDALAGGGVADVGDAGGVAVDVLRGEAAVLGEPLQLDAHFYAEQVAEVVVGQYVEGPGELAFGEYIRLAEGRLVGADAGLLPGAPDDFAPVVAACIEGTAVVEDYAFYQCAVNICHR